MHDKKKMAERAVSYILTDCDNMDSGKVVVAVKELSKYLNLSEDDVRNMESEMYDAFDDYMGYESVVYNKKSDTWDVTFNSDTVEN